MQKFVAMLPCLMFAFSLFGQGKPDWLDEDFRSMKFPPNTFYTGFAYYELQNNLLQNVTQQAKTEAQADLSKKIRLQISSKSQNKLLAINENGQYSEMESFSNQSVTEANAEVVGIKTESYYDPKAKIVYAFAYADKYELIGYYKNNLALVINQIEGILQTAQDLETNREKAKARQQLELAQPLFSKIRYAQDLLTAVDVNAMPDDLQQTKTEMLYNTLIKMQAQLAQSTYLYVSSNENMFNKNEKIIANKIKADFAYKGCSFVDNLEQADFRLKINANVRLSSQYNDIVFCYADVEIELFDNHKQKTVFGDEFSEKGGSSSQEKAGRKAMENAANKIAEKLKKWIEN